MKCAVVDWTGARAGAHALVAAAGDSWIRVVSVEGKPGLSHEDLIGCHCLIACVDEHSVGDARDLARNLGEDLGLRVPLIIVAQVALPRAPADARYTEQRLATLGATYWEAAGTVLDFVASSSTPRFVVVDDDADEFSDVTRATAVIAGLRSWLVPVHWRVGFNLRTGHSETEARKALARLVGPGSSARPARVAVDILLGTPQEGLAVVVEMLLATDALVHPISSKLDQPTFDERLPTLARAFPGRVFAPVAKRKQEHGKPEVGWEAYLTTLVENASLAAPRPRRREAATTHARPRHFDEALAAACLTLLDPEQANVVWGFEGGDVLFMREELETSDAPKSAATRRKAFEPWAPPCAPRGFLDTWAPNDLENDLAQRDAPPSSKSGFPATHALRRLLPPGPSVAASRLNRSLPLRDLMVAALGDARAPDWRGSAEATSAWLEWLLEWYRPPWAGRGIEGPLSSVVDREAESPGRLARELRSGAPMDTAARVMAGSLCGWTAGAVSADHARLLAVLAWGAMEYERARGSIGKDDQASLAQGRLLALHPILPVRGSSPWGGRGLGALVPRPAVTAAAFATTLDRLKQITLTRISPPVAPVRPMTLEILVQLTLTAC